MNWQKIKSLFQAEKVVEKPSLQYSDFEAYQTEILARVRPYTMTSPERIKALIDAVTYLNKYEIEGDLVECGVWKGGSSMAMLLAMKQDGLLSRDVYLYDTFEGMTAPKEMDMAVTGKSASDYLEQEDKLTSVVWAYSGLDEVKQNVRSVEYPDEKIQFIKGPVEDTLLKHIPERIAFLRLDTDWYESTKIELEVLFPKLVPGGIMIIDDYGHWEGCKKAVDEYFQEYGSPVFLNRIDYTGRLMIKQF